jgi:uncharacterized membrane protein
MDQVILLEYVIIALQILLIGLILGSAGVVWFKYGKPVSEVIQMVNRMVASVSSLFDSNESETDDGFYNLGIIVSSRRDLELAGAYRYGNILIIGELAKSVRQAFRLCSKTNLTTIHSAIKRGPAALETAINAIGPDSEDVANIKAQFGTALVAVLVYHYEMDRWTEDVRQLALKRIR